MQDKDDQGLELKFNVTLVSDLVFYAQSASTVISGRGDILKERSSGMIPKKNA